MPIWRSIPRILLLEGTSFMKRPHDTGQWANLWYIYWLIIGVLGLFHRSDVAPVWKILKGLGKGAAQAARSKSVEAHFHGLCSGPASRFLPWVYALTSLVVGHITSYKMKWISSFPICFVCHSVHNSYRNSNRESTLSVHIVFLLCANLSFCLWIIYYVSPLLSK